MNTKEQFSKKPAPPKKANQFTIELFECGTIREHAKQWSVLKSVCAVSVGYYVWVRVGTFKTYTMARIFLRAVRARNKWKRIERMHRRWEKLPYLQRTDGFESHHNN